MTIPKAAITVEPSESSRRSEVEVSGTGFVANGPVLVSYGGDGDITAREGFLETVQADSVGAFALTFKVPVDAEIGRTHTVSAVSLTGGPDSATRVQAHAFHTLHAAALTITPGSAFPGKTLMVLGEGLPAFFQVGSLAISGRLVAPLAYTSTDRNGAFELEVVVPRIEPRIRTLQVEVGGVIAARDFEIAAPPLSGAPADVFWDLIMAGVLQAVWRYNNATQTWALFDPDPEVADLNDLTRIDRGEIVWMRLTAPHRFQGDYIASGWSLIRLD